MKSFDTIVKKFSKPKDYSKGSPDMKTLLEANEARTEESATMNSQWAPGALKRHKKAEKKLAKQQRQFDKSTTPELDKMLAKAEDNKESFFKRMFSWLYW